MTTSGTFSFNPAIDEIITEAFDKVGREHISGEDATSAIRSLNFLLQSLPNVGYPFSSLTKVQVSCSAGTPNPIALSGEYLDIENAIVTRTSVDTPLRRQNLFDYHRYPRKDLRTAIPTQFAVDKKNNGLDVYIYHVPSSGDVLEFWCPRRIMDVTQLADQTIDLNPKYHFALVYGLAHELAQKKVGFPIDRLQYLKQQYDVALREALYEDRDRGSLVIKVIR